MEKAKSVFVIRLDGRRFVYVDGDLLTSVGEHDCERPVYQLQLISEMTRCEAAELDCPVDTDRRYGWNNPPAATLHGLYATLFTSIPDLRAADREPMRQFCAALKAAMEKTGEPIGATGVVDALGRAIHFRVSVMSSGRKGDCEDVPDNTGKKREGIARREGRGDVCIEKRRLVVKSVEKPYGTPLATLITAAAGELQAAGLSPNIDTTAPWDCKALFAESDGTIVGFLCWKITEWRQEAWICLGYVKPDYRRQGVYTMLYQALRAECKRLKLRSIAGGIHHLNTAVIKAAEAQGRALEEGTWREWLPFEADAPGEQKEASANAG